MQCVTLNLQKFIFIDSKILLRKDEFSLFLFLKFLFRAVIKYKKAKSLSATRLFSCWSPRTFYG